MQRSALLAVLEPLSPQDWEHTTRVIGILDETHEYSARFYADWLASHEHRSGRRSSHVKRSALKRTLVQSLYKSSHK